MDICRHVEIALLVIYLPAILAGSCDDDWQEYGDKCYYFSYNITASRDDALTMCIRKGGILASAANKDINDYLLRQMRTRSTNNGNKHHWIGLVGTAEPHITSNWRWLDGSFASDMTWYPGEPSSERTVCGKLGGNGTFNLALGNKECQSELRFICETEIDRSDQGWIQDGHNWYLFSDTTMKFLQAFNECLTMDASLAKIENRTKLEFFRGMTSKNDNFWIGLTTLHWLDHYVPITYTNFWNTDELSKDNMNNPCVFLHTSQNKWEIDCKEDKLFICQKAKPTTRTSSTVTTSTATIPTTSISTTVTTTQATTRTTAKQPPNDIVVPHTNDEIDMQMTTESRPTSNIAGNSKMIQMDKEKMPMIAGIVAGIVIVIIVVVVIAILLYRRRKLSHAKAEIALVDDNFSPSSADDTIQPYGMSAVVEDNDMQPYGTSEIQPYGTSDMKTIEDNALNHKYESEGVSPLYDDVHIDDKENAMTPPDVKQQLPVYAVVNKPKDKLDPNSSKGGSERTTKSSGSSSCDNNSLTINTNINNMPVYAVVDIAKKKAANTKEENAEQRSCKSADDADTPIVETNKNKILVDDVLPVYAVVDKTKKNLASVPKQIKDQLNQPEKQNINTISVPTDGPIYAVVDKNKKVQSPKPIPPAKPSAIEIQNTEIDDISTHIYSECENISNGYAEFDIQEGTEESNKFSVDAEHEYAEVQFKA